MVSSTWVPKRRSHTNFQPIWPTRGRPPRLQSFGLAVLEVDFSRSEFWLEIKILSCKSTSGNTKMASELELVGKQKNFINEISWFLEAEKNHGILLIKFFCLATNSISDAIFVFAVVDLHNRILISSQNSNLEKSASSTARPKLWRLCAGWR